MYVQRNEQGKIIGVFVALQPGFAEEFLLETSSEIAEFYQGSEVDTNE